MRFAMPKTTEELVRALREGNGSRLCAGGTDLMIRLREKRMFHYSLIDLTHIPELARIEEKEVELQIGAAVTMSALEKDPLIARWTPALAMAAGSVGSAQIRNRATVGGNVANASQSSDLTPVLLAYEAKAAVCDKTGRIRILDVDEIVEGLGKTSLEETDAILWFLVRKSSALSGFSKIGSRKSVAISKVNACIKADIEDGRIRQAVVTLGAVGPKARRSPCIESALEGTLLENLSQYTTRQEGIEAGVPDKMRLKEAVYAQIEENIPDRSSRHYKKPAAFGIIRDILIELKRQEKRRDAEKKGGRGRE